MRLTQLIEILQEIQNRTPNEEIRVYLGDETDCISEMLGLNIDLDQCKCGTEEANVTVERLIFGWGVRQAEDWGRVYIDDIITRY